MNRHISDATNEVRAEIPATVVVYAGDLMFLNNAAGAVVETLAGAYGTADYKAYPFMAGSSVSQKKFSKYFLGVAMGNSEYGSTDTIAVATTGVFKFPLYTKSGVTLGAVVGGVSHTSRGADFDQDAESSVTWNYTVGIGASGGGSAVSVGYCVKEESGASYVRVRLMSIYGEGRPTDGNW